MVMLLSLPYTYFILLNDNLLQFPESFLDRLSNLEIPRRYCVAYDRQDEVERVSNFIRDSICDAGFFNHYIHDVIKYEVAVHRIKQTRGSDLEVQAEEFSFDVEDLIEKIHYAKHSHADNLLDSLPRGKCYFLFINKNEEVSTLRLPAEVASVLIQHNMES